MKNSNFITVVLSVLFTGLTASSFVFGQCAPTIVITRAANGVVVPLVGTNFNPNNGALASACIDVAATNSTEYIATITHSNCPQTPGVPTYSITTAGGIEPIGALPNPNLNVVVGNIFTSTIRFRSRNDVLCRGRIRFRVTYPPSQVNIPACTTNCGPPPTGINAASTVNFPGGSFAAEIDIFKTITAYDAIIGPRCVAPGELVTYSINPRLQCANDGLGIDNITWLTSTVAGAVNIGSGTAVNSCPPPYTCNPTNANTGIRVAYVSSDRTSITLLIPTPFAPINGQTPVLGATIGTCPVGGLPLAGRSLFREGVEMWITQTTPLVANQLTALNSTPQTCIGSPLTPPVAGLTCTPGLNGVSNVTPGFTINGSNENGIVLPVSTTGNQVINVIANGNGAGTGLLYTWTPTTPIGGFGVTQPSGVTSGAAVITVEPRQTGRVSVLFSAGGTANVGNCGNKTATYSVYRVLTPNTAPPLVVPTLSPPASNYLVNANPVAGSIPAGTPRTCFTIGQFEDVTLINPPVGPNAVFRWVAPAGWTIAPLVGTATFSNATTLVGNITSVRITATATSVSGQKLSVKMVLPNYFNGTQFSATGDGQTWSGATDALNPLVVYPFGAQNLNTASPSGLRIQALAPLAGSPKTTNVVIDFPNGTPLPGTCGAEGLELQTEFQGIATVTATGIQSPTGAGIWACSNTYFATAGLVCPPNYRNAGVSGNFNVPFRTGTQYTGFYRVRVRTIPPTSPNFDPLAVICPELSCYESPWAYYPFDPSINNSPQNWRMAVDNTWEGGEEEAKVEIFPNPSHAGFTIKVPEAYKSSIYNILSLDGKLIAKGKIESTEQAVGTKDIPKGVYILRVEGKNPLQEKLIIE